jgi:sulfur-oxidizing protein SoxY
MNDRRRNPLCPPRFARVAALVLLACSLPAAAQAPDTAWQALETAYFPGKKLEHAPFIRLTAPARAASGEQVPFSFSIDHPMSESHYIKSVSVFVDGNPVPLTAAFHFGPQSGKPDIATRIRLESDSPVHVVAEASDGRFYVNTVTVRASGGCSGPATGDEAAARVGAGTIKLALDGPFKPGDVNKASLLIRHPMSTGMQRDPFSHGFRPAWFIDRIAVTYNGKPVLTADTNIGISENPSFRFGFVADKPGALQIVAHDNEGGTFRQTLDVGG